MKALIPAAGLGTRWYPWSRIVPKELLPLGNYPAIHYVLEEAVATGISEIGIIISEAKKLIRAYVDEIWKLDYPEINVRWFYQSSPRGVADALLCASKWIQDETTSVLYPDEIHPPEGGLVQLCRKYESSSGSWIGLTANKQKRRQAILKIEKIEENVFHVYGLCPQSVTHKVGYATGRYILGSGLSYLNDYLNHVEMEESEELDDDKLFEPLWEQGVRGIVLYDPILDIGTPANWFCVLSTIYERGETIDEFEKNRF